MPNHEPPAIRRHVVVTGRVQGVWYRDACRRIAEEHDVRGWVRNRSDGSVEAVFEGAEAAVDAVVSWCRTGPPRARVDAIGIATEEPSGECSFRVR